MAILLPGPTNLSEQDDVSFTSVTRGDIPYRGASAWNNLPSSTAGFVLTSNGAGADPSWQSAGGGSLTGAVILAPNSANRNLVLPAGDFPGFIVKQVGGQSVKSVILRDTSNNDIWYLDKDGNCIVDKQSASDTVGLFQGRVVGSFNFWKMNPYDSGGATRMTFANSIAGNVIDCTVGDLVYVAVITGSQIWRIGASEVFRIDANGGSGGVGAIQQMLATSQVRFGMVGSASNDERQDTFRLKPVAATAAFWRPFALYLLSTDTSPTTFLDSNGDWQFQRLTTTTIRAAGSTVTTWATSTDATRKARVVHNVYDTAIREALRLEASGSAPMIGFLGGAAVVQQVNASQAAITAVADANAKAALQAIYNLLLAYNLAPATA